MNKLNQFMNELDWSELLLVNLDFYQLFKAPLVKQAC